MLEAEGGAVGRPAPAAATRPPSRCSRGSWAGAAAAAPSLVRRFRPVERCPAASWRTGPSVAGVFTRLAAAETGAAGVADGSARTRHRDGSSVSYGWQREAAAGSAENRSGVEHDGARLVHQGYRH